MADLVDRVKADIDRRLSELRPMVEEARQLETALAALDRPSPGGASTRGRRAGGAGRRASAPRSSGGRAARGATQQAVLDHLGREAPATAGQIAAATGMSRTSIAATLSKLRAAGVLTKAPRGYELASAGESAG